MDNAFDSETLLRGPRCVATALMALVAQLTQKEQGTEQVLRLPCVGGCPTNRKEKP